MREQDALKTYRYLRVGLIGAVVLLTSSIGFAYQRSGCLQSSISSYYYTPARAVFVGSMVVVGFALIVYKGRAFGEDIMLNIAGILAPIVAIVPTTDIGLCADGLQIPPPTTRGGAIAGWVLTNIQNNIKALLLTGMVAFLAALAVAVLTYLCWRPFKSEVVSRETVLALAVVLLALVGVWWLFTWHNAAFIEHAHALAAQSMFIFLNLAILANVLFLPRPRNFFRVSYLVIAGLMIAGAIVSVAGDLGEHEISFSKPGRSSGSLCTGRCRRLKIGTNALGLVIAPVQPLRVLSRALGRP